MTTVSRRQLTKAEVVSFKSDTNFKSTYADKNTREQILTSFYPSKC